MRIVFAACLVAPLFLARSAVAAGALPELPPPATDEAPLGPPPTPAKAPAASKRSVEPAEAPEAPAEVPEAPSEVSEASSEAPPSGSGCPTPRKHCHDGFYLRMALGGGYVGAGGRGPFGDISGSGGGGAFSLGIGGTLDHGIVLAGFVHSAVSLDSTSISGLAPESIHGSVATVLVGGLVDWYPSPAEGWHLGAALGFGGVVLQHLQLRDAYPYGGGAGSPPGDVASLTVAGSLVGGYDWWIGEQWSFGLQLVATGLPKATLRSGGNDTGLEAGGSSFVLEASFLYH